MAGVVVEAKDPVGGNAQMVGDERQSLGLGDAEFAAGGVDQPELGPQLAETFPESATSGRQAHPVVLPAVGLVLERGVEPLLGRHARAGQRDEIDVARRETELRQDRVHGAPGIPRVVLHAGEALFAGAADDLSVLEDGGGRAVGLVDTENDHLPQMIALPRAHRGGGDARAEASPEEGEAPPWRAPALAGRGTLATFSG